MRLNRNWCTLKHTHRHVFTTIKSRGWRNKIIPGTPQPHHVRNAFWKYPHANSEYTFNPLYCISRPSLAKRTLRDNSRDILSFCDTLRPRNANQSASDHGVDLVKWRYEPNNRIGQRRKVPVAQYNSVLPRLFPLIGTFLKVTSRHAPYSNHISPYAQTSSHD
jgi:hypothetical protein